MEKEIKQKDSRVLGMIIAVAFIVIGVIIFNSWIATDCGCAGNI